MSTSTTPFHDKTRPDSERYPTMLDRIVFSPELRLQAAIDLETLGCYVQAAALKLHSKHLFNVGTKIADKGHEWFCRMYYKHGEVA